MFVLKCKDGFYFIGRTTKLIIAILKEFYGLGSEITKEHQPIKLVNIVEVKDENKDRVKIAHNKLVVDYMRKHGFEKIRGGEYYHLDVENHKDKMLKNTNII